MRLYQYAREDAPKRPSRTLSGGNIENAKCLQNLGNNHIFGVDGPSGRNAMDVHVQSIPIKSRTRIDKNQLVFVAFSETDATLR